VRHAFAFAALAAPVTLGFTGAISQVPPAPSAHEIGAGDAGWVALGCSNPGTQQDAAKTPSIENTTAAPIPRGRSLLWTSSDGDRGGVTLGADLAPGDAVKGTGKPARGTYTCRASFHAGAPDLLVLDAKLDSLSRTAVIANTNPWLDAAPVRVRFELAKCSDDAVIAAENVGPFPVTAGGKQAFRASVLKPWKGPPAYFRISVDVEKRVRESNEKNNSWSNRASCPR
jgi:hypothetical protein